MGAICLGNWQKVRLSMHDQDTGPNTIMYSTTNTEKLFERYPATHHLPKQLRPPRWMKLCRVGQTARLTSYLLIANTIASYPAS